MKSNLRKLSGLVALVLLATAGTARAATFDLFAKPGTILIPGVAAPTPVWGFATTSAGAATVPGPVLVVTQGDTVTVNLANGLAEPTALDFPGQALIPDQAGVGPGATTTYSFTAGAPGTYLYQAGLLPGMQHQAPMGLYGALVVRPASAPGVPITGQAYASPATAYDDEAVLVLSELDPALNAAPSSFDLRNFAPRYWLINGQPYPGTTPISTVAGHRVLLRYLNAGLQHHSMALLGLNQTVVAQDGSPRRYGQAVVAETVAPGQTLDAITTIPAASPTGSRFALHDGSLKLYNGSGAGTSSGFGGMLTFLITSPASGGSGPGPLTTGVALAPNPTNGSSAVAVTASITADLTVDPANTVGAAELFVDAPGAAGTGLAMAAADGIFDGAGEGVTGTIPAATAAALLGGPHTIYVHGQDASLAWGAFASATLTVDRTGPTAGAVALAPNPTSGALDVAVGSTLTLPGGAVDAAEYFIDSTGAAGTGTAMTGVFGGATVTASGAIAAATQAGLASGSHSIYVRGRSATGNWGAFNFAILTLDKLGPAITGPTLTPGLVRGAVDVAVHATGNDSASGGANVVAAEYAIDGGAAVAMSVNFAAPIASLDAVIPAAVVGALAEGARLVSIRSRDALGNWGAPATVPLTVDRTMPLVGVVTAAPSPANGTVAVRVSTTVTDAGSGVAAAEGFLDASTTSPPAPGTGFPFVPADGAFGGASEAVYADLPAPTVAALTAGSHTASVRGRDAAGNWGALVAGSFSRTGAIPDTLAITATTSASQATTVAAPGLLTNDIPVGATGRTAVMATGPVRTGGSGTATIRVTCGAATNPAGVCSDGSYRVTLTAPASATTGAARQASKLGTYRFTYRMTLGGVSSAPATVTITVN